MPGELGPMQNAARPNSQVLSPLAVLGDWRGSRPPRPRLRSLWHTCFQQKGGKGENWGREFYPNKRIPSEAGHDASTASWTGRNGKMPLKSWKPPRGGAESLRANQKEEVQFFREIAAFWLGWPLREGGTGLQIHPKPDLWISLFAASSAPGDWAGIAPTDLAEPRLPRVFAYWRRGGLEEPIRSQDSRARRRSGPRRDKLGATSQRDRRTAVAIPGCSRAGSTSGPRVVAGEPGGESRDKPQNPLEGEALWARRFTESRGQESWASGPFSASSP